MVVSLTFQKKRSPEKDEVTVITQDDFEKSVMGYLTKSDPITPELIYTTVLCMLQIRTPTGIVNKHDYTAKLCRYFHKRLLGESVG